MGNDLSGRQESSRHRGLIAIYEEPDDPQADETLNNLNPLFLYIDDNNGISYPGFVRKP